MGERTGIAWARGTYSPWIGCTEISVGPEGGCNACYARELDARYNYGGTGPHWGAGRPRHRTSPSLRQAVLRWDKVAAMERETGRCAPRSGTQGQRTVGIDQDWHTPGFWPLFPSLCDPFDNEVADEWHAEFWSLIRSTSNLTWLLLTKRVGNVPRYKPAGEFPHVWIGASVVNQPEADRDLPKLIALEGFGRRFVSYEPALGPIDFAPFLRSGKIDQVIVGGESKQGKIPARAFNVAWARRTVTQCRQFGASPFVKQLGAMPFEEFAPGCDRFLTNLKDRAGADPAEWDPALRVQEFPEVRVLV